MVSHLIGIVQEFFRSRIKTYAFIFFLLCLASFSYLPILINIDFPARGDWDHAFFTNAVPFITIKEFHQFPFWNPFYCGGFSYIASPESTLFSIQTIFSLLTQDVITATKVNVVFHAFIGLAGMWLLCLHFELKFFSTLVAMGIFVFNGCMSSQIGEGPLDRFSIFFLPWIVLFFLKSHQKNHYVVWTGLALALMFYDKGGYTFIFTVLFLAIYSAISSLLRRDIKFLVCFFFVLLFWVGFSAPKLFPLLTTMSAYPRLTKPGHAFDILKLLHMYVFRNPDPFGFLPRPFNYWGWWEFNAYVGIMPFALFLGGLTLRKYASWCLCAAIFFVISIGNFGPWSLWALLHRLPVFNTMQIPNRDNTVFIFILAFLAGAFLNEIEQRAKNKKGMIFLVAILSVFILVDLVGYTRFVFQKVLRPFPLGDVQFSKSRPFEQIRMPREQIVSSGAWSHMYAAILQNKGTINGYCRVPFKRYAKAGQDRGYRGEFFLKEKNGDVQLVLWSPNQIVYKYDLVRADRLVINQNYDRDWRVQGDIKTESFRGLLSVPLNSGKGEVVFYYFPSFFLWGLCVFCFTCILSVVIVRKNLNKARSGS
ncbi:MAG: hypothetical protein HQL21_04555 [Candidatus Omnitrophica bacterium]|nr:hypothetical protein [Candidatus Omnitrophota bacterium]